MCSDRYIWILPGLLESVLFRQEDSKYHNTVTLCIVQRFSLLTEYWARYFAFFIITCKLYVCVCVCVRAPLLNITRVCVFSHSFLALGAHEPYCHMQPVPDVTQFSIYPINGTVFQKNYWTYNVFLFSLQHLFKIPSHSKRKCAR